MHWWCVLVHPRLRRSPIGSGTLKLLLLSCLTFITFLLWTMPLHLPKEKKPCAEEEMRGRNAAAKGASLLFCGCVRGRCSCSVTGEWRSWWDRRSIVTAVAMLRPKRWSYFLRMPPGAGLPSPSCSLFSAGTTQPLNLSRRLTPLPRLHQFPIS